MLEKLKKLRLSKNISQHEMAKLLGYKYTSAYNMIETGKRQMKIDTAIKIAEILGVTLDEIFFQQAVVKMRTTAVRKILA